MNTKAKSIAYWTMTVLVAFFIGGGVSRRWPGVRALSHGFVHILGYPPYFVTILGVWKVLGPLPYSCRAFRGSRNGRMPASSST